MIDDGVSPARATDEPDAVLDFADGELVFPDDHIAGSLPEMVIDLGESQLEGPERSTSSIEPDLALPEDLWGESRDGTGAVDALSLELGAETAVTDDVWRPAEDVALDAFPLGPPVVGPAQRRPTLAPPTPPLAPGRWQAMRRSVEDLHLNRRVAAVGLAGIAAAGLFATLATRSSEGDGSRPQVVSAGTQPVASVPASSVPRSTSTTVATTLPAAAPSPAPASAPGEAPITVVANGSPPPPTTAGQVAANRSPLPAASATTAPPRSNPTVATSPPQGPAAPAAPPATRAPPTIAEPQYEEPDTPPTTRRPRVTLPETTAVPTTTSSTTSVPPAED